MFSLEKRVKEIMHKAFWDSLEAELSENPPSYSHAIKMVGEIKEVMKNSEKCISINIFIYCALLKGWVNYPFNTFVRVQCMHITGFLHRTQPTLFLTIWIFSPYTNVDNSVPNLSPLHQTLLSFLLPGQSRLRGRIEEALDLSLIQQEAENGALDIGKVARFIIDMMATFCAPCRDQDVKNLREITDIVPLFK